MFELASPWILLILPLPWLIWFFMPRAVVHLPSALKIPFFKALMGMVENNQRYLAQQKRLILFFLAWILIVLALAGPRWIGEPQPLAREGYNIMLALDISGSMELSDMMLHGRPATRLAVVKQAAEQFVLERVGDRIGLILFGSRAYLQTPLTYDHHNVLLRLEDATVGLAGNTTSLGDALGLAIKRLQNVPSQGRMIILLTDGVNNTGVLAPIKAAELARADGIKVYTIGLGVESEVQPFDQVFMNMSGAADLDEETLKEVSQLTGGHYFRATDMKSLQTIYHTINQMEKISQEQATIRPQHEYYPWPLGLAVLLLLSWLTYQLNILGQRLPTVDEKAHAEPV